MLNESAVKLLNPSDILVRAMSLPNSRQMLVRFSNNYGASIVQGPYTYGGPEGLYELGVIKFTGPTITEYNLDYTTPIGDDVFGFLEPKEVMSYLEAIKELDAQR